MFEPLGKLVGKKMGQGGIAKTVRASIILGYCDEIIREMFGKDAVGSFRSKSFKDGTVRISCDSSVFAEGIRLREQELIEILNRKLGRDEVDSIAATG